MIILQVVTITAAGGAISGHTQVEPYSVGVPEFPAHFTSRKTLGVQMFDATHQTQVGVLQSGLIRDVTTGETWNVGDLLWCTPDGLPTNVRPTAPAAQIYIGVVVSGVWDGEGGNWSVPYWVDVNVQIIPTIGELSGVFLDAAPPDRAFLVFHDETKTWVPQTLHSTVWPTNDYIVDQAGYGTPLDTILCDATTGPFTVWIPHPQVAKNKAARLEIKKIDATRNIVTIDTQTELTIYSALSGGGSAQAYLAVAGNPWDPWASPTPLTLTVLDYTALTLGYLTLQFGWQTLYLTEGTHWDAVTSNVITAASLQAALAATYGLKATVDDEVVTVWTTSMIEDLAAIQLRLPGESVTLQADTTNTRWWVL